MTPVQEARLRLELAEAEERLTTAKTKALPPDELRQVKLDVRAVRQRVRSELAGKG